MCFSMIFPDMIGDRFQNQGFAFVQWWTYWGHPFTVTMLLRPSKKKLEMRKWWYSQNKLVLLPWYLEDQTSVSLFSFESPCVKQLRFHAFLFIIPRPLFGWGFPIAAPVISSAHILGFPLLCGVVCSIAPWRIWYCQGSRERLKVHWLVILYYNGYCEQNNTPINWTSAAEAWTKLGTSNRPDLGCWVNQECFFHDVSSLQTSKQ